MNRVRISLAAAIMIVFSHPLRAQDAKQEPATNAIHKGDQWTYNDIDDITGKKKATITFTVTEVNDKQIALRSVRDGQGEPGFSLFMISIGMQQPREIGKSCREDSTGLEPPLVVGKEWRFKHRNQNTSTGVVINVTTKAKVIGQETMKVASQEYGTFKIETQIHQVIPQNGKPQDISITTWYAPAINRWVKRSWTIRSDGHVKDQHTHELVEFTRGK